MSVNCVKYFAFVISFIAFYIECHPLNDPNNFHSNTDSKIKVLSFNYGKRFVLSRQNKLIDHEFYF